LNHSPDHIPVDTSPSVQPTSNEPLLERAVSSFSEQSKIQNPKSKIPTVSVVVLNYNGLRHLETCFTSLLSLDYPKDRLELLLVDNGSADGSLEFMRERFPTVRLVETGSNLGFAAGNNYGAERASGEYVAFLNNDTRVEPYWLTELVNSLLAGAAQGVVCTSSLMLDWAGKKIDFYSGSVNFHGFGFQPSYGLPVDAVHPEARELLFACGGSMLIRREVFLHAGGFDPDYFAFFEDVDLGWRLWLLGHRITLTPTAITYHRHHGTATDVGNHRWQVIYERNALYTIYKNYEQSNLDKILPAALLLLGQRVVRFMELGGVQLGDYDFTQARPTQSVEAGTDHVHRNGIATLLAADEFRATIEKMTPKREWLQANRKRTDEELFARFGQPGRVHLLNHETDAPYSAAHHAVLHEFGIEQLWDGQPKDVLLISPDVLPVGDIPASGSGIRAWALGKGLESRGHKVRFTMPKAAIQGRESQVPLEYVRGAWTPETLQSMVDTLAPEVIVSCGWPNLTWLPRANLPVALDLTGPHLLERIYQEHLDARANAEEKLVALERADFFTCISERQRYYFTAWLAQAGVHPDDIGNSLQVIPYSLDPEQPQHVWPQDWGGQEVRFVYGGIFLPWQNPAPALLAVASELQEQGRGRLEVIGGKHPFHAVHTGGFGPLVDQLATMPSVSMSGLLPHDALVERYTLAHVAVDVMQPNAERQLAFPSRTVHYLWCGLPVIHAAFSEVAGVIREHEAGWIVRHDDPDGLRAIVASILADPSEARRRGENAARLARERFTWDLTVDALDRFVRDPYIRSARMSRTARRDEHSTLRDPSRYVTAGGIAPHVDGLVPSQPQAARKLQTVHDRRRTVPAQVRARANEVLRSVKGAVSAPLAGQVQLPELVAGHSLGQRFYVAETGLSGVRVQVETFGRRNTSRLFLRLRDNPGASVDLFHIEIPTHNLTQGQLLALRFPPIPDSAGRAFYFVAESPDGVPGDAISLRGSARSGDLRAQRYDDGIPASGYLVMSLEYNGVTGER
jgi:GT2 family glycosyltransferase/glycosyltransferase involved in cell wall biosynthesis